MSIEEEFKSLCNLPCILTVEYLCRKWKFTAEHDKYFVKRMLKILPYKEDYINSTITLFDSRFYNFYKKFHLMIDTDELINLIYHELRTFDGTPSAYYIYEWQCEVKDKLIRNAHLKLMIQGKHSESSSLNQFITNPIFDCHLFNEITDFIDIP
jgi:hypothetical protein